MGFFRNAIASDVKEKVTKKEYVSFGSYIMLDRTGAALRAFFGGLVASTFIGLSEKGFMVYSTIIFILGFWDIANDVIVANILDKRRKPMGQWGRFKPWMLIMLVPVQLIYVFQAVPIRQFFPGAGDVSKIIYLVTLSLLSDIVRTFFDSAHTALGARRTTNQTERGYIAGMESIIGSIFGASGTYIAAGLAFLLPHISDAERYFYSLIVVSGITIPFAFWYIISTKERIVELKKEEVTKLRDVYTQFLHNKPLLLIMISDVLGQGMGVGYGLMTYMFIANFAKETITLNIFGWELVNIKDNYAALLAFSSLASIVTTGISLVAAPIIRKWIDDKVLYIGTKLLTVLCYAAMLFSLYPFEQYTPNQVFGRFIFWYALHGLTTGFYNILPGMLSMTAYDYNEYKFGERNEATVSALTNTLTRIVGNITSSATNGLLVALKYKQFAETPELMPANTKASLFYLFPLLVASMSLLSVIPMLFFNINGKRHKQMVEELSERRQLALDALNQAEEEAPSGSEPETPAAE